MASKILSGTATYTDATRTISGASMTPVFDVSDQIEQRQVVFTFDTPTQVYYGRIQSFGAADEVILQAGNNLPGADGTIGVLYVLDLDEQHSYADYISELKSLIKDDALKLTNVYAGDLDRCLANAVHHYSQHKPFYVKKKIQGNGTSEYLLSSVLGGLWQYGYSQVRTVEYPIGSKPKELIEKDSYEIYDDGTAQDGSNLIFRFIDYAPSAAEYFILEFSTEMNLPIAGIQNFPDTDQNFANITLLAAVFACQRLAAVYAQSKDNSISADIINYQDKSDKYLSLARAYLTRYNISVFGKENPEISIDAALREIDLKPVTSQGRRTLFH